MLLAVLETCRGKCSLILSHGRLIFVVLHLAHTSAAIIAKASPPFIMFPPRILFNFHPPPPSSVRTAVSEKLQLFPRCIIYFHDFSQLPPATIFMFCLLCLSHSAFSVPLLFAASAEVIMPSDFTWSRNFTFPFNDTLFIISTVFDSPQSLQPPLRGVYFTWIQVKRRKYQLNKERKEIRKKVYKIHTCDKTYRMLNISFLTSSWISVCNRCKDAHTHTHCGCCLWSRRRRYLHLSSSLKVTLKSPVMRFILCESKNTFSFVLPTHMKSHRTASKCPSKTKA